jgi:hypothetical protein
MCRLQTAHRASKLSIYDFRHGRGTEWGRTGNLIGIAYLIGHKHVTTTKEYLHSNLEEGQAVLFPTSYLTSPADAAPTTAELIAQAAEMIGCGREDSNLHECYLTRSLADLADQKANEFKGASRSGTPENTLGRSYFSPVVKNRARDLLRAVVDGGDVSVARIRDFARAVIETPAFQVAQEILQDASPEFAVRKVLELASMVLSADDGVAESVSQRRSAMKKDRSGTLAH